MEGLNPTDIKTVSPKLKEKFCKDCNIPIKIFEEPYFFDRLKLYNKQYDTLRKWYIFVSELEKYKCEQDYFEEYNCVKDKAIMSISNSIAYQRFIYEDMNKYRVTHKNLPNKDIYHPSNDGKLFISIDMKKANFSSLQHYGNSISESMFAGASTWEDFIGLFTNNQHIINSKYIRQVILGNCNAKRHIKYEKYLMDNVLDILIKDFEYSIKDVVFFSNDEIILDMKNYVNCLKLRKYTEKLLFEEAQIPLKVELFKLHKIKGINGYYKEIYKDINETEIELKCVDNYMMPFVLRKLYNKEITDNDKVFYHEGHLAQFIHIPEIEVI